MKTTKLITIFICFITVIACNKTIKDKDQSHSEKNYLPVDYTYPTDSTIVNRWIATNDFNSMYKHSWDVWKHLTTPIDGKVLRYQTWSSPKQILHKMNNPSKNSLVGLEFNKPNQFSHSKTSQTIFDDTQTVEVVAYNPAAEQYAITNKIFYLSTLKAMQTGEFSQIPEFPNDAITIKPVYKVITQDKVSEQGIYTMAAWHGPEYKNDGYPEKEWNSCIHVDLNTSNKSNPNGRLDYKCDKMTTANTYYLNDFIHFTIDETLAKSYNSENNIKSTDTKAAKAGDKAILVAMHVGTKEIKRWVWQTFWWSPTPLTPSFPSSDDIASAKYGIGLQGAASHYAMDIAYSMLIPAQPYIGGKNEGELVIGYNPYLESGFDTSFFDEATSYVYNKGTKIATNIGTLSNCMSCHMSATINTKNGSTAPYVGDTYLSYKDSIFQKRLMLDFAWSIQSNIDSLR